ncbi:MAG: hypothetical protein ABI143_03705 [Caldimonas sp.]
MAWSNIFLQLITPTGPVIGEGMLTGWETSIELESFKWECKYDPSAEAYVKGGFGAASLKSKGLSMLGLGGINLELGKLTFEKRFDVASAMIHTCLDNHLPIISASITVLNIKHGGRGIHQPGFTLVAADGFITSVDLKMVASGNAVEVKEEVTLDFKSIVISYLKVLGKDNIPTNPFFYVTPAKAPASPLG